LVGVPPATNVRLAASHLPNTTSFPSAAPISSSTGVPPAVFCAATAQARLTATPSDNPLAPARAAASAAARNSDFTTCTPA
jgi:hypothetical protein